MSVEQSIEDIVPPLDIHVGGSESDACYTARSTASSGIEVRTPTSNRKDLPAPKSAAKSIQGTGQKIRKSFSIRNGQKKKHLVVPAAPSKFVLKSQIPKAILTPSYEPCLDPLLSYRKRRSISQIDLKQVRRTELVKAEEMACEVTNTSDNSKAVVPVAGDFVLKPSEAEGNKYFYSISGCRSDKHAGLSFVTTIMLHAWRKRGDEVKRLNQELRDLKKCNLKTRNQIHVLNTLFHVEQKRNDELNAEVKRVTDELNKARETRDKLTASLGGVETESAALKEQLAAKQKEYDGLSFLLDETRAELARSNELQDQLRKDLAEEQRLVVLLQKEKAELKQEVYTTYENTTVDVLNLKDKLEEKTIELDNALAKIKSLEDLVNELKAENTKLDILEANELKLKSDLEALKEESAILRKRLDESFGQRIQAMWKDASTLKQLLLFAVHGLVICTLPVVPMPRLYFPIGLPVYKASSIMN